MKMISRTVFTLALAASAMTAVKAADTTYTVTFDPGNAEKNGCTVSGPSSGTFGYKQVIEIENVPTVTCSGKYYVSAWHESGIEAEVAVAGSEVTKDVVYLPIYRVAGNTVNYTVKYVDAKGKEIASQDTFTGNIGDKVIVPYKYIEGYHPKNAYNITQTLSENEGDNVFKFVYAKMTGGTIPGPVTYITEDGGITYIVVPAEGGGNSNNSGYWRGNGNQNRKGQNGSTLINTDTLDPELIVDQDKEVAPASGEAEKPAAAETSDKAEPSSPRTSTIGTLAKVGAAAGGGILLVLLLLFLTGRRTVE